MVAETRIGTNGSTAVAPAAATASAPESAQTGTQTSAQTSTSPSAATAAAGRTATPKRSEREVKQRQQALLSALGQIEKQFGKGSIMTLGRGEKILVEGISTGSVSLDVALGGYGLPRGRISEIYGPESSGKTTLCLHVIANAQRAGGVCAFIDAEHAFDATYAKHLGVNLDELLISQPDTGEQALEIAETLIRSNAIDVIVVDSVAALVPKAEIEGEMGDSHVGLQARLMSQALRKLSGAIRTSNAVMIFTNQMRMKIGVMFGNPETTSGGNALKFYASVRIDMRRIGSLKGAADSVIGNRTRAKVVKNKIAPPFRMAEFDVLFGKGIDRLGDLLDLATHAAVIEKSGTWLSWKQHRLGQGRDKAREFLTTQPDLVAGIEKETMVALSAAADGSVAALPTTASNSEAAGEGQHEREEGGASKASPMRATTLSGAQEGEPARATGRATETEVAERVSRIPSAAPAASPSPGATSPGASARSGTNAGAVRPASAQSAARPTPVVTKKTLPPRPAAKR